jgi:hypothetical protein
MHRAAWRAGVLGSINVLTRVLAARLIVLVAVAGGIWLTWVALGNPTIDREIILAIYTAAVVIPAVALAAFGR